MPSSVSSATDGPIHQYAGWVGIAHLTGCKEHVFQYYSPAQIFLGTN